MPLPDRNRRLLLIEDNQADIELVKILLGATDASIELHAIKDGLEASEYFAKTGRYEGDTTSPDLILMDLNVPKQDGRELLKKLKEHSDFCKVPVVIFSTSSSDQEVSDSYCLGASAFVSKPIDLEKFQETLGLLVSFYFKCARLATLPMQM